MNSFGSRAGFNYSSSSTNQWGFNKVSTLTLAAILLVVGANSLDKNQYIRFRQSFRFIFLLFILVAQVVNAAPIYRYQDDKGRWHFTDKKPKQSHEEINIAKSAKKADLPEFRWANSEAGKVLISVNPWYAPVQFEIWQGGKRLTEWVVEARESATALRDDKPITQWVDGYEYRYRLGRPVTQGDNQPLRPPVPDHGKYRISQGFKGKFSHLEEPNHHAIDIAMNISDFVHAARDGVVVAVKDDYHMGGRDRYFLDKANYIYILHDDDTYAVYAHVLLGSIVVKEGQRVKAGDVLANAGTSGYSTGPHLHFVLRANDGASVISLPFKFSTETGLVQPTEKSWLRVGGQGNN